MKVIEIIDTLTILVDYGLDDGAEKGDCLRIYQKGDSVKDPSGRVLGTLDIIKDVVQVIVPYNRFSICQKQKTVSAPLLNPWVELAARAGRTVSQPLNVNPAEITNRKIPSPTPISVGDPAMLISQK